ncbi:hypothetical protein QP669_25540, partial [Escherichia coli]|nr:hypothetical protein [Escherichia coli]
NPLLDLSLSQLRQLYKCRTVHNLKKLTRKKARRRTSSKVNKLSELTTGGAAPGKVKHHSFCPGEV